MGGISLYEDVIKKLVAIPNGFKEIEKESKYILKSNSVNECFSLAKEFYQSEDYQVRGLAVFICGSISSKYNEALMFLRDQVSMDENWRVQEILAKAFDTYCKDIGYEAALPTIREWLNDNNPNLRRAVIEGLRIWTGRDYFQQNPRVAVDLLARFKDDPSEYVRKSAGNALRDISKKHGELIRLEVDTWDVSEKSVKQVYQLASKFLMKKRP